MSRLQGRNDPNPSIPVMDQEHGPNTEIIKNAIPDWLIKAAPGRRAALRGASMTIPQWYKNASVAQRKEMKRLTEASIISQTALDRVMSSVTDITAFAEPILIKALADTCNVHLDVRKVCLRLRKPVTLGPLQIKLSSFTVMTLSLLDAALHNFEAFECKPGAFDSSSGFVIEQADGTYETVTTSLTVEKFTTLCRVLDIGQLYQNDLKSHLQSEDAVAQAVLSRKFIGCQKDALQSAAYLALVKNDIELNDYNIILSVIAGEQNILNANIPVWFWEPVVMGFVLTGCLAFATTKKYSYGVDEVILYIPHDPEHPVRKYRVSPQPELTRQLMATASSTGTTGQSADYRSFLSQFIDYKDRPAFFNRLTQKAADTPFDPLNPLRAPIVSQILLPVLTGPLGSLIMPNTLPPQTTSPREPATEPDIHLTYRNREGLWAENGDLWAQLYQRSLDKIFADARSHAVPTADVDAKTRTDKIAHLLEAGMGVLNLVSMFVPVLGEVMLGVMAAQLMYETLEGSIEWSEGDREAAWAHLSDVAENLALMGVMAAGGRVLNGVKSSSFVDSLRPVQLPSDETRLWKPDLAPYRANIDLPAASVPNELGLHAVDGQQVLSLDGQRFVVSEDPATGEHRLQHPERAQGYAPLTEHNGDGGWIHEGEEPLTWDGPALMRRLGYRADAFSDGQLEDVRIASGLESDQLRQMHAEQTPPSVLLSDTLTRFRIDHDIETFALQIESDDPAIFTKADPRLQFRIMRSQELLPPALSLRVIDSKANIIWDEVATNEASSRKLVMVVNDQELARGNLQASLLQMLEAQGVDLAEIAGESGASLAQRATALRKNIAQAARKSKASLFDSLYRAHDATGNRAEQRIKGLFPELPSRVARQILEEASAEELGQISQSGPLPQGIYTQARWCQQELRVARAYEGFYLDASANTDSHRLALHSLPNLPGWPQDIRLELREYWEHGRLLDAIGNTDAVQRKVLVLGEDGRFAQAASGDFYAATLQALSQDERQALGFTLLDVERLKQAVRQAPLAREAFRDAMLGQRALKPAFVPGSRLLGGAGGATFLGVQPMSFLRSSRGRIRKLYPDFSEADVEAFLHSLGSDVRGSLTRQEAEYANLKRELKAWVHESRTSAGFGVTKETLAAENIKRCWRRQTGATLEISLRIDLPALSADFSHVEALNLGGVSFKAGADSFLKRFTRLKRLRIVAGPVPLVHLPQAIGQMKELTYLELSFNSIVLTERSASVLENMSQLEHLNLSNNPLSRLPDFSHMSRLQHLDLSFTGIDQWPTGVEQQPLRTVDLRNNRLQEVPAARLALSGEQFSAITKTNWVTLLDNNPFSRTSLQQLEGYRREIRQVNPYLREARWDRSFDVTGVLKRRYLKLHPDSTVTEVEAYFDTLAGVSDIETAVSLREEQFSRLDSQLIRWSGGGRPTHVRMRRNGLVRDPRQDLFTASDRIRLCWQRRTPQMLADDGSEIGIELDLSDLRLADLPRLEGDFSHVGSLVLKNMGLTAPPEAFLQSYRGVRWLDLKHNQLTELPQALSDMQHLSRLNLKNNRIRLTPDAARILAERTTLKTLDLSVNPIGMLPDFAQMTDLRSLFLRYTGIETWPAGLGEQPRLDTVDLRNNALVTIPDEVIAPPADRLQRVARLNNVTYLQGNPLSEATQEQLTVYWDRLEREQPLSFQERNQPPQYPMAFEYQAPFIAGQEDTLPINGQATFGHWSSGMSAEQRVARRLQWQTLFEREKSRELLSVLTGLQSDGAAHEDLQLRIWGVLDSITQLNPESEQLREEMFEWSGAPTCCDRAALTFSNLEIKTMVYNARALARDGQQGPVLLSLARGLFRLDTVEKIALADIERRIAAINRAPGFSQQQKIQQIALLEDVEIKLAYRVGLQDSLELPGQPGSYRYTALSDVSADMLKRAYNQTMALSNSAAEFQALVARDFWREFLASKYKSQFDQMQTPYQTRQASLDQALDAAELDEPAYTEQTTDLDAQLQIEEASLVEKLTRQELDENPYQS